MKIAESMGWNWDEMDGPQWNAVSDEFLPVALRWKDRGHRRVLDLGCGVGRHALFMAELGMVVTASDISRTGLRAVIGSVGRWLRIGGDFFVTFNSKRSPSFRRSGDERLDSCSVVKRDGPEAGIPHTFVDYEDIVGLLSEFEILRARLIQDISDGGRHIGWHYFVEARYNGKH